MTTVLLIVVTASPLLGLAALLWLTQRAERRRNERYARQIELTDAIHGELGAVAAPMLSRLRGGGWLVSVMLPLDRPATVTAVLAITERVLATTAGGDGTPFQVTIIPRPRDSGAARADARRRSLEPRRPVAALN
jgi:hypothetical protein